MLNAFTMEPDRKPYDPQYTAEQAQDMVDVTAEENKKLIDPVKSARVVALIPPTPRVRPNHRTAPKLKTKSSLGNNDAETMKNASGGTYWRQVLVMVGIRPQVDEQDLATNLGNAKTFEAISESNLYREIIKILKDIKAKGQEDGWNTTSNVKDLPFPSLVGLEGLRIQGDANKGFGSMPNVAVDLLRETGLAWMCTEGDGEVPIFWQALIRKHITGAAEENGVGAARGQANLNPLKEASAYKNLTGNESEVQAFLAQESTKAKGRSGWRG
jgi:hypothetical protein